MRLNLTASLTALLLITMGGAGFASAMWGIRVGDEALKGVSSPDSRPTKKTVSNRTPIGGEGLMFLREEDILAKVKADIESKGGKVEVAPEPAASPNRDRTKLPMSVKNNGVFFALDRISISGNSMLLDVRVRNEGNQAVRFLYSFLTLTDDRGRAVSGITQGLPSEFPPTAEEFSGTISIPTALTTDVKSLNLSLTDYPEQQVHIKLNDIPIAKP